MTGAESGIGRETALPWQAGLVTAGFASIGLAFLACSVLVLWALRRTEVAS